MIFSQSLQPLRCHATVKATAFASMAGRAIWLCDNQQRILIAIDAEFDKAEEVPTALALGPKLLPTARKESNLPALLRLFECLAVHMPYHQHSPIGPINDHRGQQPTSVKFRIEHQPALSRICHILCVAEPRKAGNHPLLAFFAVLAVTRGRHSALARL